MSTLYDIDADLAATLARVADGEEVDNVAELLELNEQQHVEKLTGRAYAIQNLKAESDMFATEIKRLQARKKAADRQIDWLKATTLKSIRDRGIKEPIECGVFTLSDKPSKAVKVDDVELLPSDYRNQPPATAKKADIKAAIERGETVKGAELVTNHNLGIK